MIFTTSDTIKNNGIIVGSPFKPNTMTQGSELSNALRSYAANSGGVRNGFKKSWGHGSEEYTFYKKIQAVGTKKNNSVGELVSYKSVVATSPNSALIRCRSGGCVAPKKKGAVHI
jgi:hypothetical protein